MKKIIIIISILVVSFVICSKRVTGQNQNLSISDNANKKVVTIGEIDYLEETYFTPSGLFSLNEMIESLDVEVFTEDRVEVFPDPKFGLGSILTITRATPVKVIDARKEQVYRTWKAKVSELFEEVGIEVGDKDKISVNLDQNLSFDMEIKITRVLSGSDFEYEDIDYKTVTKKDPNLERGVTKISQTGRKGKKKLIYNITRENGIEISRKLVSTEIIREVEDRVILEGTKITILGTGRATWYRQISGNTAAHNTLPMGSEVIVRASNGKSVRVKIVDRGIKSGAIIDLSADAFGQLASLGTGVINVTLEKP